MIEKNQKCSTKNREGKKEGPHRTARPPTLAVFLPWGGSEGAGRMALGAQKYDYFTFEKNFILQIGQIFISITFIV